MLGSCSSLDKASLVVSGCPVQVNVMTLAELADSLPNGFHDSALKGLRVDYEQRLATISRSVKVGDPDGPPDHRDDFRGCEVQLLAVLFVVIDPPDHRYNFGSASEAWIADGYETNSISQLMQHMSKLLEGLPRDAFAYSFFVNDWNSYVHVAARDCALKWAGGAYSCSGQPQAIRPGTTIEI